MNKILRFLQNMLDTKEAQEKGALEISKQIGELTQLNKVKHIPSDFRYEFGKWALVIQSRCFQTGWITLFEIQYANHKSSYGYANTVNPDWITVNGTRTANCPPQRIVKEFFKDLEEHLDDKITIELKPKVLVLN